MGFREDLKRWYNINKKLPMDKENKFWLIWEKNRLLRKRLLNRKFYRYVKSKPLK